MRRVNYISDDSDSEPEMVLQVNGDGDEPFTMRGLMCGNEFEAIIDTGSPVSIFPIDELRRIVGKDRVIPKEMVNNECYVDFNRKPLPLLGYTFVRLLVRGIEISKARVLIATRGSKAIVGRDWLIALRYKIEQPMKSGEWQVNNISQEIKQTEEQLSPEVKQIAEEFPNLFKRSGRVNNYKIKIEMKENAKITQQKGRRIPLQLQNQVDKEIENLLKSGHIERVDKINDDVFIQPVVITVKKDRSVKIALDARALNESIAKDKNQKPN